LYADGGRACEWFYHILANPGDEVSTWVAGKMLSAPIAGWQKHLDSSVERIYGISRPQVRQDLCEAFLAAESAYFRYISPNMCGTISLEPLVSSSPGAPVYLAKRLTAAQRSEYRQSLGPVRRRFQKLLPDVADKRRMKLILRCIDNAGRDATE